MTLKTRFIASKNEIDLEQAECCQEAPDRKERSIFVLGKRRTLTMLMCLLLAVLVRTLMRVNDDSTQVDDDDIQEFHKQQQEKPQFYPLGGTLNSSIAYAVIEELPPPPSRRPPTDIHKFWAMFASKGWVRRQSSMACFKERGFWESLGGEKVCDRNWYQGGFPPHRIENCPDFRFEYKNSPASALLGDEMDLFNTTCTSIKQGGGNCSKPIPNLAHESNHVMLRLDSRAGWNMCRNLEWVVCALRGNLPGQEGENVIRFATTPQQDVDEFLFRDFACDNDDCEGAYAVLDIYFAEVAIISYLCRNNAELFELQVGQDFRCDFFKPALKSFQRAAERSPGGFGQEDMWIRPPEGPDSESEEEEPEEERI